jgi:hypothetical protein
MPNQGMEGVLSPEQLDSARASGITQLGLSLMGGSPNQAAGPMTLTQQLASAIGQGQGAFRDATGAASSAMQLQEQQRQQAEARTEKERVMQARQRIAGKYPPAPNETPEQTARRLNQILGDLVTEGVDKEAIGSLSGYLAANNALLRDRQPEPMEPLDETPNVIDPETGKPAVRFRDRNTGDVWYEPMSKEPSMAQQGAQDQRLYQRERDLARDYATMAKQYGPVAEYYANANASRSEALKGNAIAQHSLIFNYMHVLEPTSIVREGEYAAVARRNGMDERIANIVNLLDKGQFMPTSMVGQVLDELDRLVKVKRPALGNKMDQFRRRAERWGVDPSNVIFDPFYGSGAPEGQVIPPPTEGGAGGGAGDANKLRGRR